MSFGAKLRRHLRITIVHKHIKEKMFTSLKVVFVWAYSRIVIAGRISLDSASDLIAYTSKTVYIQLQREGI